MELLGGTYTTNSSQYFKTIAGNAGGRFLVIAQSATTANVFNFDITGIAGATDSADGFTPVGGIAQNGAWTLGPSGFAAHTINGSVTLGLGTLTTGTTTPNATNIGVLRNITGNVNNTVQGFSGGRSGQILYFWNSPSSATTFQPSVGTQPIVTFNNTNVTLNGNTGATFVCDGTNWRFVGISSN